MPTQTPPLRLTRDQLATFLTDQKQIRAFENLFSIVEDIAPDVVQQVLLAAGSAQAAATDAQGQVQSAEQALGTMLAACEAKASLALQQVMAMKHIADLVETMPPHRERKRTRYGSFYNTTSQTAPGANTATEVAFDTTDISNGVYIGSPNSRIYVDTEGIYNIQVTLSMDNTSGGNHLVNTWLRVNGSSIAYSSAQVRLQGGSGENFESRNFFYDFKAGDYFEIGWSATDVAAILVARAATAVRPEIPSASLTVSNNIRGEL